MDSNELTKCGSFLRINIHNYDTSDGNTKCSKHIDNQGEILPDVLHIYLVLDNNNCNAISSADSLLCFMLNAHQVNCDACQKIITTPAYKKAHTCTFKHDVQDNEPPNLW